MNEETPPSKERKKVEAKRARRFAERLHKHDAATPPVQRNKETNFRFNERARRFKNRVRPTWRVKPPSPPPPLPTHESDPAWYKDIWSQHESERDRTKPSGLYEELLKTACPTCPIQPASAWCDWVPPHALPMSPYACAVKAMLLRQCGCAGYDRGPLSMCITCANILSRTKGGY